MMNTILVIFFSLSANAGTDLVAKASQPQAQVEAVSPEDAQALYDLMDKNRQRIFAGLGENVDPSVSPKDAQVLYSRMDDNRKRIFDSIGEKVEQEVLAGLDIPFAGDEAVYVSAAK